MVRLLMGVKSSLPARAYGYRRGREARVGSCTGNRKETPPVRIAADLDNVIAHILSLKDVKEQH